MRSLLRRLWIRSVGTSTPERARIKRHSVITQKRLNGKRKLLSKIDITTRTLVAYVERFCGDVATENNARCIFIYIFPTNSRSWVTILGRD